MFPGTTLFLETTLLAWAFGSTRACAPSLPGGSRLDRNRREFGRRPKPLRRKHSLRKVEAEELVGTVLIRHRQAAPHQQHRAKHGDENIFQDHEEAV